MDAASMANGHCPARQRTREIRLPHLPLPARPSSPLTPHCSQSIGPGLLDRSIALYRAVAVCPRSNHRGPSSCRHMQGSASSPPSSLFSFRLTDFLHGSLARPGLSAALLLGPHPLSPSPSVCVYGPASHGLWCRQSTILLPQARLFLVSGDPYCSPSDP